MSNSMSWLGVLAVTTLSPLAARSDVTVQVDATTRHQTIEGYGATTSSLAYGAVDNVPYPLRLQAIDAIYNQVKLNMGNLEIGPFESPANALYSPANDNGLPGTFNPAGFNWTQSDNMKNLVVDLASPFGFDNFYIGPAISEAYEFAWAVSLRNTDYNAYLDECAEHVATVALHWRDSYGINPPLLQLWNEPIGGNGETAGGSVQELVDVVKRTGARLRQEGLQTLFVVPADETEQRSLDEAIAILSDPLAAQYVGAIAYHPYPYGSTYASVPNILSTSGSGNPSASEVQLRNQLRDLGALYNVPVFMVEVSHSDLAFRDFDGLRGRAIQIHDEMTYADVAAFFGMNSMWDSVTNDQHFAGRTNPGLFAETDTIALIDDADGGTNQVYISEMGYAIGHYARWVPKGSVRLDASSDDALVQVTAFRDDADGRLALVLINNSTASRTLQVSVGGLALNASGQVTGEQSMAGSYWQPLSSFSPTASGYSITLPGRSVTSLGAPLDGAATNTAPLASAGSAQTVTLPASATLRGTASDDGLPNPPGQLTTAWSMVSGPGTVTFGNVAALTTTASFSAAGTYVLQLSASDSVLTTTRTVTVTVLAAGAVTPPIAWWRFDEGQGTVAADATGNGHTGTVTGAPAWTAGHDGQALQFDGSSGYVAVADFNPPTSLTMEAWVNPLANTGTDSIILNKHNSEYDFRIDGTGHLSGSAGGTALTDATVDLYGSGSTGVWHHVVYTFDGVAHVHALYLDGQQVAQGANASSISNQATSLWIGRHSQFDFGTFRGALDEVRLYDRAISAAEVTSDYTGVPSTTSSSSSSTSSSSTSTSSTSSSAASSGSTSTSAGSTAATSTAGSGAGSTGAGASSAASSSGAGSTGASGTASTSTAASSGTSRGSSGSGASGAATTASGATSGAGSTTATASGASSGGTAPAASGCGCGTGTGAGADPLALLGLAWAAAAARRRRPPE